MVWAITEHDSAIYEDGCGIYVDDGAIDGGVQASFTELAFPPLALLFRRPTSYLGPGEHNVHKVLHCKYVKLSFASRTAICNASPTYFMKTTGSSQTRSNSQSRSIRRVRPTCLICADPPFIHIPLAVALSSRTNSFASRLLSGSGRVAWSTAWSTSQIGRYWVECSKIASELPTGATDGHNLLFLAEGEALILQTTFSTSSQNAQAGNPSISTPASSAATSASRRARR